MSSTFPSSAFHTAAIGSSSSYHFAVHPSAIPHAVPLSCGTHCDNPLYDQTTAAARGDGLSSAQEMVSFDPLSPSARVRSCDVYVGFASSSSGRHQRLLIRFVKWLRAELEMQGVACFASDRGRCRDARAHSVARAAMDAAAFGVVVVTARSLANPYSVEELRWFLERKNLVPVFFGFSQGDCVARDIVERRGELWERFGGELWTAYGGVEREWRDAVNGLSRSGMKLEVNEGNFREKILDALVILGRGLGRRSIEEKLQEWRKMGAEELPFPRNVNFVGRKRELLELEMLLFGDAEANIEECIEIKTCSSRRRRDTKVGRSSRNDSEAVAETIAKEGEDNRSNKGKEPVIWKESEDEIELQGDCCSERPIRYGRKNSATKLLYGKGVACVCGDSGIGKTELLLEFAYRFAQSYKMVLWVGGEARYLRQNYMNLLPLLGVDVTVENRHCPQGKGPRSFKEIEAEAIGKVRKELMRDIPFLLVIDNLEKEKDWWDGRSIMELLPRFSGETHVIISTRLPRIMHVEPLRLLYLSGADAMSLMKRGLTDLRTEDVDALRLIEEKLGRLPIGLALVGAILSELSMNPPKLLDSISRMPFKELRWNGKEDLVLRHNPFLVQLLDMCFSILDHAERPRKLATRMVEASSWFAPSSIPISLLAIAASETSEERQNTKLWKRCLRMASCTCISTSNANISEAEASSMLVRFLIARSSTKVGYISFHDIIKLYARKRSHIRVASSVVRAVSIEGNILLHADHIWAACFLIYKFGVDPAVVNLSTQDMISFIRRFVLPLASCTFTTSSRCSAALELLRLSTEALQVLEESFLSENNYSCLENPKIQSSIQSDPLLYRDIASLRATLLEARANFMLQGGQYDIGEQLCRTAININEVLYGWEHPKTQSTRETMERLITLQLKF